MKYILLTLAIMSAPIKAETSSFCVDVYTLAEKVMEARQRGVTVVQLHQFADGQHESMQGLLKEVINDAFDYSLYSHKGNKESAVDDFSNKWFLACTQSE